MTLSLLLAVTMVGALTFYVLLGGADYGGGVWDLLSFGQRADRQRKLIAAAITPVWETNHVWLILVVVLLFTGFPAAFAAITTALHIPLLLLLAGIVFRGSSFTFRHYQTGSRRIQRYWGFVFSIASILTPVFLGIVVGSISSGNIQIVDGISRTGFVRPWLSLFSLSVGFFAVSLFAYLAAVYLAVEAADPHLQEDFRRKAIFAGLAVALCAGATFALTFRGAPAIREGLPSKPWSWGVQITTALAALGAFWALWRRRYHTARFAVAIQACCILWGWALSQYPFLVRPDITIANSAAPDVVLRDVLLACVVGALFLAPSLFYLFKVFKSTPSSIEGPDFNA